MWFHLREDGYVPQLVADGMVKRRKARDAARYLSEDDIKGAKARRLRREILVLSARPEEEGGCGRGEAEVLYREPKEVAERIGRDLVAALAEDLPAECRSLWAVENFDQAAAARALLRTFVKGDAYVELERQIIGARGAGRTHAIVGPEGSGKSSMCAHLDMSARENKGLGDAQIDFVHMHMAGCSRYGANPLFVMRRIMHELKGHFEEGAPESTRWPDVPTTPAEALNQLDVFLRLAGQALAARGALGLIIVDGVDKLDTHSGGGPAALVWLKWKMPFNILLVRPEPPRPRARGRPAAVCPARMTRRRIAGPLVLGHGRREEHAGPPRRRGRGVRRGRRGGQARAGVGAGDVLGRLGHAGGIVPGALLQVAVGDAEGRHQEGAREPLDQQRIRRARRHLLWKACPRASAHLPARTARCRACRPSETAGRVPAGR